MTTSAGPGVIIITIPINNTVMPTIETTIRRASLYVILVAEATVHSGMRYSRKIIT